jgi:ClpP class serine protease
MSIPQILLEISKHAWAMTPDSFDALCEIAESGEVDPGMRDKFHALTDGDMSAVVADVGSFEENNRYTSTLGSRAFVFVDGPIVPRSGNLQKVSGLVATSKLAEEMRRIEADETIEDIFMIFDTPGGAVTGISEMADLIAGCDKKTTAYVYGMAASAGYWLASACDKIISADTGIVGSIGTVLTARKFDDDKMVKVISKQSPNKQPEPGSAKFLDEAQKLVDGLTDLFVDSVAAGRGVSRETVLKDFGRGGVFLAEEAKERGMVDAVATLEEVLADGHEINMSIEVKNIEWTARNAAGEVVAQSDKPSPASAEATTAMEVNMDMATLQAEHPELVEKLREQGAKATEDGVKTRLEAALPILTSDAYPAKIKAFAEQLVRGECTAETLAGAVAGFDAATEAAKEAAAIEATNDAGDTPVEEPKVKVAGAATFADDGIARSEEDLDEIMKEVE